MEYLFVYGTLMKDAKHPMYNLILRKCRFIGNGIFKGKLFLIDYYPGSIISTSEDDSVSGEVYELKNAAQVLASLDRYEEYDPNDEKNSEFIRRKLNVTLENGTILSAWVYLYNFPTKGLKQIFSGDFRTYLHEKQISQSV